MIEECLPNPPCEGKKRCFKCGEEKSLSEFYKHPRMKDGRLNKCKGCTKKDVHQNYQDNIEDKKAYEKTRSKLPHRVEARKKYAQTEAGKRAHSKANARYRKKNPEKRAAHNKVQTLILSGRLKKQPCAVCQTMRRVEAHHPDYSKPDEVVWLCPVHHAQQHWGKAS